MLIYSLIFVKSYTLFSNRYVPLVKEDNDNDLIYVNKELTYNEIFEIKHSHLVSGTGTYVGNVSSEVQITNPFSLIFEPRLDPVIYTCLSPICNLSFLDVTIVSTVNKTSGSFKYGGHSSFKESLIKIFGKFTYPNISVNDELTRIYFSTKSSDSQSFFTCHYAFNFKNTFYNLLRGIFVYHLSPQGRSSKYRVVKSSHETPRLTFYNQSNSPIIENEETKYESTGFILLPDVNIYDSTISNNTLSYTFEVEDDEIYHKNVHHFPPDLSLLIPDGFHTLEEVKDMNKNMSEDYKKNQTITNELISTLEELEEKYPVESEYEGISYRDFNIKVYYWTNLTVLILLIICGIYPCCKKDVEEAFDGLDSNDDMSDYG
ncbi:hypothetical protein TVAG_235950 [Trichomonas vaginalis G3]|uniref:Uncharacterized protein n=1 Tax=Trichomonas vaginalis (strain ATCC PRA-98 / G3) TaxID=412133 RepID=A2FBE9_TRIV3|nr:hypothetical protein TVAGG3_0837530 [Trichomonas vaginalis G3]EAX97783.1 hypothetical protein TVAG_235950 [Trichomonas vaginalis G3]KAI5499038.1 hypothetical protein TVAGG3_0837530 [Trichomonas vaginalis G3]|eukprot:XP_001310713.1 hypothetical protein [Trichomonas vaginalis G3]